jgi:outer membrane receptor protein involved in Fe transport
MQRSRKRKLARIKAIGRSAGVAGAVLAAAPVAFAQQAPTGTGTLEEVVVTATKREESLQNVPLSITALGTERLEELRVTDFADYVKFLPSVAFTSIGPGFSRVFMRGVASGDNGNHSGSLPSVGVYLDEQPITTIQGALDLHIYDIARVESLAGPQGTLYGASSQAGTVRIITNKPDPSGFAAGYDLEGNAVRGEFGYVAEGYLNLPVGEAAAVRLVAWSKRNAGFIDNVAGTNAVAGIVNGVRRFPTWDAATGGNGAITNAALREDGQNEVRTHGARAALRIDLDDTWTITPTIMGQKQETDGSFAFDPAVGDLAITHFYPDTSEDKWWQAALTVEGRFSNFDVTYAGAFLKRDDKTTSDYSDYSFFYDSVLGYGAYYTDAVPTPDFELGTPVNPHQYILGKDGYRRQSHELRIATPADAPVSFVGGVFWQRQRHNILQNYKIDAIATDWQVTGWPGTLWLTNQQRVDRDKAVFGELTWKATEQLSVTGGIRFFWSRNSLVGFYGFGPNFSSQTGESNAKCQLPGNIPGFNGAPCNDLPYAEIKENGNTPKINVTYRFDDDRLVYATWSKGFRPGGVNRRDTGRNGDPPFQQFPPYRADFLKNYEFGWKTTWGGAFRFNGAVFWQKWNDFQYSYLGPNAFTIVTNAGGARIKGVEGEVEWVPTQNLQISGGFAFTDAKLTQDFCKQLQNGQPLPQGQCPDIGFAASGTRLPVTPRFKANLTGRYGFPIGGLDAHVQASVVYAGARNPSLLPAENEILGRQASYAIADVSAGVQKGNTSVELFVNNAFDRRADLYRFAQCPTFVQWAPGDPLDKRIPLCGQQPYTVTNTPRTVGIKFGQRF